MNIPTTVCPGCFGNKGQAPVCNLCGYDESERRSPLVLPHRTVLQEQYVIGKVLGKPGGFGITYLAFDVKLQIKVAIKEFLPRDLAGRDPGQSTVFPHSNEDADIFTKGLQDFLKEAQNLAQFDHANIVRVRTFFQTNNTAYIVMDFYDGITLMEYLQRQGGRMEWQMAVKIMTPIMDALREVHGKGFLHRDVKPQNIYLTRENRIILLDFGSARQAMGERTRSLTQIMTPGFAPFEQYHRQGRQGPWTDVYGVAATLYFMITGQAPPEATERVHDDALRLPSHLVAGVPDYLDNALVKGLAVKAEDRFGDIQLFINVFLTDNKVPHPKIVVQQADQSKIEEALNIVSKMKSEYETVVRCQFCGQQNPVGSSLVCVRCRNPLVFKEPQNVQESQGDGSFSPGGCLKGVILLGAVLNQGFVPEFR